MLLKRQKNGLKQLKKMTKILTKALNQDYHDLDKSLLNEELKDDLRAAIIWYLRDKSLLLSKETISRYTHHSARLGLGIDFIDEIKSLLF